MITETMTVREIREEFLKDMPAIQRKLKNTELPRFSSIVLHTRRFPVSTICRYTSPERKNRFIIKCTANKRGDHKTPMLCITGIYDRQDGRYAINLTDDRSSGPARNVVLIFSPHFFSRYRERFLKEDSLSNDEVIETYLKRNSGISVTEMSEKFATTFEKYRQEGSVVAAGRIEDGNVIARVMRDNVILMLTFLTDDMLHDNQKKAFGELEKNHEEYLARRKKH